MSKEKTENNNVENVESTAMVSQGGGLVQAPAQNYQALLPTNREQLEMLIELNNLERTIESIGEKTTKPSDLVESGVVFDILDGWFTEVRDGDEMKQVVCFQLEEVETGINHIVMQSRGSIRDTYANYFGAHKAVGMPKRLANYRMVWTEKTYKAGNPAAIFERVRGNAISA